MTEPERPVEAQRAMQRLRDRTDELELIISSLTLFALFSLPGWLHEFYSSYYTHFSVAVVVGGVMGMTIVTGLCYVLASCFVLHLLTRAYWVGLIGLRTVFPDGIDWTRTPGVGPISRDYYRKALPDLAHSIERADRLASSLFSVISLLTLSMLWVGFVLMVTLAVAGQIGARFGMTNQAILYVGAGVVLVLTGFPTLQWLLDRVIGRRVPRLQKHPKFQALVRGLARVSSVIMVQRLVLPVQLTLQSNTRPLMFVVALTLGAAAIVLIGNFRVAGWQNFTASGEFDYINDAQLRAGVQSAHYEDQRTVKDRVRAWPMIPSFQHEHAFLPLFLPYQPLRDNPLLDRACEPEPEPAPETDSEALDSEPRCLRRLWTVRLNDTEIALDGFLAAERGDLKLRGLIGIVPLRGLEPGLHWLHVRWNPGLVEDEQLIDDRYADLNSDYRIPFLFAPAVEMSANESGR